MARPDVVSADEWERARGELLVAEKQVTRQVDAVAAQRRRLPMVAFRNDYVFQSSEGPVTLLELFGDNEELVVYQFMDRGPDTYCPGCTWFTDNVPVKGLDTLRRAGVRWATISTMPLEQIESYKAQRGWTLPFYSSHDNTFAADCGVTDGFMLSVFLRDGDDVFRTYNTTSRGVDRIVFTNSIQDLLPFGRREAWEDSPPGWPKRD